MVSGLDLTTCRHWHAVQALTCSTGTDMQYRHWHALQALTCSTGTDMQYRHWHALQALTCTTGTDIQYCKLALELTNRKWCSYGKNIILTIVTIILESHKMFMRQKKSFQQDQNNSKFFTPKKIFNKLC